MTMFTATYSAEDNKLRLYADEYLDKELYAKVTGAGFKWAPKQELFVAPKWTPEREDLCIELSGTIEAEQTTMVERAEQKAERLQNIAENRVKQSIGFAAAADRISQRFEAGQPILIGHHSERRARKDKDAMERNMEKSIEAAKAVDYWNYRAAGVAFHANHKNRDDVRARRIKKLLAELRDRQRTINHGFIVIDLWEKIDAIEDTEKKANTVKHYIGGRLKTGDTAPWGWYDKHSKGEMSDQEVIEGGIAYGERLAFGQYNARWINHILNRLGYERYELGEVAKFDGQLTAVILQAFAREQGAHKPKAELVDDKWQVSSSVPLPAHIGDGTWLNKTADEWFELMQAVGYQVEIKKKRPPRKQACSLVNPTPEDAAKLQALWNEYGKKSKYSTPADVLEMEQAHYSANSGGDYGRYFTIELDANGSRIWSSRGKDKPTPVCRVRATSGAGLYAPNRVIIITDKAQKSLPFDFDALLAAAKQDNEDAA